MCWGSSSSCGSNINRKSCDVLYSGKPPVVRGSWGQKVNSHELCDNRVQPMIKYPEFSDLLKCTLRCGHFFTGRHKEQIEQFVSWSVQCIRVYHSEGIIHPQYRFWTLQVVGQWPPSFCLSWFWFLVTWPPEGTRSVSDSEHWDNTLPSGKSSNADEPRILRHQKAAVATGESSSWKLWRLGYDVWCRWRLAIFACISSDPGCALN